MWKKILLGSAVALLLSVVGLWLIIRSGKSPIPVAADTTVIDGPLAEDGHIDYAAWLNERGLKGLKTEDNAAVHLWRAIGRKPDRSAEVKEDHFTLLGMEPLPEQGDYFVELTVFADREFVGPQWDIGHVDVVEPALDVELGKARRLPWTTDDSSLLAKWLKANEKPLAHAHEAARRERCYFALVTRADVTPRPDLMSNQLLGLQPSRMLGCALAARSMLHAGEGRFEEAWRDALACHRLGRLIGQSGSNVEGLVGIAVECITCKATAALIERFRPDRARLASIAAELRRLPAPGDIAEKVDTSERFIVLDMGRYLEQKGLKVLASEYTNVWPLGDLLPVDMGEAMRTVNRWQDDTVAALRAPTRDERLALLRAIAAREAAIPSRTTGVRFVLSSLCGDARHRGRQLGELAISRMTPNTDKIMNAYDRVRQEHANLLVALALESHRLDKGAYPAKLSDLAEKAPDDLFSGKELIYKRDGEGYLLYSVGPDGLDGGGKGSDDDPKGDDIAVRMPAPKE